MAFRGSHGYIVFDTETTGLPQSCFIIVQLYYKRVLPDGEVVRQRDMMLAIDADDYPGVPGVAMHPKAVETHGISESERLAGEDPRAAVTEFLTDLYECIRDGGVVVGHNVQFDIRCLRNTISLLWPDMDLRNCVALKIPCMCTQVMSQGQCCFVKLEPWEAASVPQACKKKWGDFEFQELMDPMTKYSKLIETAVQFDVEYLEGKGAHDAKWDTELTDLCFQKLLRLNPDAGMSYTEVIPFVSIPSVGAYGVPSAKDANDKFSAAEAVVSAELELKFQDDGADLNAIEQGTEEWYRCRRAVTASQVGALIGHSKYETPFQAMIGKIEPQSAASRALNFGNFFEDLAQHLYVRHMNTIVHDVKVRNIGLEVCPKPFNFISVSPDGLIDLQRTADSPIEHGILEIKTAQHSKPLHLPDISEISILQKNNYYDQVQLEMHFLSQKYGWKSTFCHFVFFNVDVVDDPLPLASDTVKLTELRSLCAKKGLDGQADAIFDSALYAEYDQDTATFWLPYSSHVGANSTTYPLVVGGAAGSPIEIFGLVQTAIPYNFDTARVGYVLPLECAASPELVRSIVAKIKPLNPQFCFNIFNPKKLKKGYITELAAANGLPVHKKEKKENILDRLRSKCGGSASCLSLPRVTSKPWISICTFTYNKVYCESIMIPSVQRMYGLYRSALAAHRVSDTAASTPPCIKPVGKPQKDAWIPHDTTSDDTPTSSLVEHGTFQQTLGFSDQADADTDKRAQKTSTNQNEDS
jgi:hypothetical protein